MMGREGVTLIQEPELETSGSQSPIQKNPFFNPLQNQGFLNQVPKLDGVVQGPAARGPAPLQTVL